MFDPLGNISSGEFTRTESCGASRVVGGIMNISVAITENYRGRTTYCTKLWDFRENAGRWCQVNYSQSADCTSIGNGATTHTVVPFVNTDGGRGNVHGVD